MKYFCGYFLLFIVPSFSWGSTNPLLNGWYQLSFLSVQEANDQGDDIELSYIVRRVRTKDATKESTDTGKRLIEDFKRVFGDNDKTAERTVRRSGNQISLRDNQVKYFGFHRITESGELHGVTIPKQEFRDIFQLVYKVNLLNKPVIEGEAEISEAFDSAMMGGVDKRRLIQLRQRINRLKRLVVNVESQMRSLFIVARADKAQLSSYYSSRIEQLKIGQGESRVTEFSKLSTVDRIAEMTGLDLNLQRSYEEALEFIKQSSH